MVLSFFRRQRSRAAPVAYGGGGDTTDFHLGRQETRT